MATAEKAIVRTEAFSRSFGIPVKLSEVGVRSEDFEAMAEHVEKFWYPLSGAFTPIGRANSESVVLTDALKAAGASSVGKKRPAVLFVVWGPGLKNTEQEKPPAVAKPGRCFKSVRH